MVSAGNPDAPPGYALPPSLRILMLGTPQILAQEKPLIIHRRLLRTMLYYLAAQPDAVARQTLIDLFWPEEQEEDARRHLREALSKLRAQLPDPDLIQSHHDWVYLDRSRVYVDVLEFSSLLHQARIYLKPPLRTPLPEAIYQSLYKAAALWRPPYTFLAGANLSSSETFDRWLTQTAQNLETALQIALEVLADHAALDGDLEGAVFWAQRALHLDESNIPLRARLADWLYALGQYRAAQEECQRLREEIAVQYREIPPEYQALCRRLEQALHQPSLPSPTPWYSLRTLHVPFVGRDDLLNSLRSEVLRGGVVLLWGEAGSGKSRLMFELYQSLQPAPRLILAAARAHDRDQPYHPLGDALRQGILTEEWQQLPAVWLRALSALLPELAVFLPVHEVESPPEVGQSEQHLATAVLQILRVVNHRARVLLFLDDAQWCDEKTLGVLAYLVGQHAFTRGNLLVIAACPEEPNPNLEAFLQQPPLSWFVRPFHLEALTVDAVGQMAEYALGQPAPRPWLEHLTRATGGNPLLVLETLRALLEIQPTPSPQAWPFNLPLAPSIHALANERLRLLDHQAREVLMQAAVLGDHLRTDVLHQAVNLPEEAFIAALEALERAYLLSAQRPGEYAFRHALLRQVLLLQLSQARCQALHRRAAQALEALGNPQVDAQAIAQHYEAAGEEVLAVTHWVNAAEHALHQGQPTVAEEAFNRAEALLLRPEQPLPPEVIYRLYTGWAELAFNRYDLATAERCYNALAQYGERLYDPLLMGSGLSGLGQVAIMRLQAHQAANYLDQALSLLEKSHHPEETMQALNRKAAVALLIQRYYDAVMLYQQVLGMAQNNLESPATARALGNAQYQLAKTYFLLGWPERARFHADQALACLRPGAVEGFRGRALLALALANQDLGDYAAALEACAMGMVEAERWKNPALTARLLLCRAQALALLGDLAEAWATLEQAADLIRSSQHNPAQSGLHLIRGDLWSWLGDCQAAVTAYREALDSARDFHDSMEALYRLGLALVHRGQVENGFTFLHRALELTTSVDMARVGLAAAMALAEAHLLVGEVDKARELARRAAEEAAQRKLPALLLRYHRLQIRLARHEDAPDLGWRHARLFVEQARALQTPLLELEGLRLALSLLDGDPTPAADDYRRQAEQLRHALFTRLNGSPLLSYLERRFPPLAAGGEAPQPDA